MREEVVVSRTCEAVMIPSGEKVLVPQGAHATITQSLGGTYTLITDRGLMVRVSGKEVEAIGKEPAEVAQTPDAALTPDKLEELVWEQLKTCFDPEIPFPDRERLFEAQKKSDQKLIELTRNLQSLEDEVRMQRQDHVQKDNVANVLMHLFQHQIHHRGQAHALLSGTSVAPPQLDEFFM